MNPNFEGSPDASLVAQVRIMQVIVCALMLGLLCFGAVATYLTYIKTPVPKPPEVIAAEAALGMEPQPPMVAIVAVLFTVVQLVAWFVIPGLVARSGLREIVKGRPIASVRQADLVPIYQTKLIVASALLEGTALLNIIAVLTDRQIWSLAIAVGLLLLLASGMPTVGRVEEWTTEKLQDLNLNPPPAS